MESSTLSRNICVLCYKINTIAENDSISLVIRFATIVARFKSNEPGDIGDTYTSWQGCCDLCRVILDAFCKDYHEIKCLKMKMEWKLQRLLGIMELAGRVPSRWSKLQQTFRNQTLINLKIYRSNIIKRCSGRISKSQPRILLTRTDGRLENSNQTRPTPDIPQPCKPFHSCTENNGLAIEPHVSEQTTKIDPIYPENLTKIKIEQMEEDTLDTEMLNDTVEIGDCFVNKIKVENNDSSATPTNIHQNVKLPRENNPKSPKWQCKACGKGFCDKYKLTEHLKCIHMKGEKEIKCKVCIKMFLTKHRMEVHFSRVHIAPSHQCSICGKSFKTSTCLKTHQYTHQDPSNWPFKCELCDKRFYLRYDLKLHKNNHHGCGAKISQSEKVGEKFRCSECGKLWNNLYKLSRHKITHQKVLLNTPEAKSVALKQQIELKHGIFDENEDK